MRHETCFMRVTRDPKSIERRRRNTIREREKKMKIIAAATISTATLLLAAVGASSSAQDPAPASSSAESPEAEVQRSPLSGPDQLSCTGDFTSQQPSIYDKPACDAKSGCVWCEGVKKIIGQGICASESQKEMLGPFWDQICGHGGPPVPPPAPPAPLPVTPMPTPKPTSPPVAPPPPPAPAPDNPLPDSFRCEVDESRNVVTDRTSCEARKADATSNCVWCDMYGLGGSCMTSDVKASLSILCKDGSAGGGLRAGSGGDWRSYDPSCLGDASGIVRDWRECATRKDRQGAGCAWCDAAGVFGVCVSASEQAYLDGKLTCDSFDVVLAVE